MSNTPKSLMSYYIQGAIISRELEHMMLDYAANARFDRELADDLEAYSARQAVPIHIHKGNKE